MLTANQLRQVAAVSGARDIGNVEIDVILTYLLQLFSEKGVTEHVAFKGGTMLRKMVFGPRGRLSMSLDFTCCTDITVDDLMLMMLEAVDKPFHGIGSGFTSTPSRRAREARSLATWCITPCPWIFLCIAGWCCPTLKNLCVPHAGIAQTIFNTARLTPPPAPAAICPCAFFVRQPAGAGLN